MSATNALNNTAKAVAASNATGVRFVTIELELGVVFCQMASTTNCERNAQRHMTSAGEAYDSAVYHVKNLVLTEDERQTFNKSKNRLSALLAEFVVTGPDSLTQCSSTQHEGEEF